MKTLVIILTIIIFYFIGYSQTISTGVSKDTISLKSDRGYSSWAHEIWYYKPSGYDSTISPVILAIHGQGMNGNSEIVDLQSIAERRNALIVAPTGHPGSWSEGYESFVDSACNPPGNHRIYEWLPPKLKQIYRHVLTRENRDSIPVYFIGFSAGGQCVTRCMLIRQAYPDSIPIIMAVSVNPYYYTFCTDLLSDMDMPFPCGLSETPYVGYVDCTWPLYSGGGELMKLDNLCDDQIIQYYNENYAVLIGTADTTGAVGPYPCMHAQGMSRYERAVNFYNFSDTDAVARGTTLKWLYGEVPGIGHNQNLMYNTILAGDSMPFAERLLFETPYHPLLHEPPSLARFTSDSTMVSMPGATVQFYNQSVNADTYLWDFGDSTTSTNINPMHTYLTADTFSVTLTSLKSYGCYDKLRKHNYIIVNNPTVNISDVSYNSIFNIYPNPLKQSTTISFMLQETDAVKLVVYNCIGQLIEVLYDGSVQNGNKYKINFTPKSKGIYYAVLQTTMKNSVIKIVKI